MKLTMIIPNRDRLSHLSNPTKYLIKSLQRQTSKEFRVIVSDGGSSNHLELKDYLSKITDIEISLLPCPLSGKWNKPFVNNYAIRKATTPYIITTDADIFFAPDFIKTLLDNLEEKVFIESRTLYWKSVISNKIYSGDLDPFINLDSCRVGRIKKRTTPGGCQCGHISIWNSIRGYDERYTGWGSEDVDLLARVMMAGYKVKWLGEDRESVMVFHQPHGKIDYEQDMKDQNENLKYYRNIKNFVANPDKWGGLL